MKTHIFLLAFCLSAIAANACAEGLASAQTAPKMPTITSEDLKKARADTAAVLKSEQLQAEVQKAQKIANETIIKFDPNYTGLDSPNLTLNMPRVSPETLKKIDKNDYEALAKKFYTGVESKEAPEDLVVFVSLSMPKESLRALAEQSARYDAVMVLRGLKDNSLKATMYAMKEIIGNNSKVNIQINPVVFTKLDVKQVPTFAIVKGRNVANGDAQSCAPASAYMSIAGDVPMEYALEKLSALSPPDFASIADAHLKLWRGN